MSEKNSASLTTKAEIPASTEELIAILAAAAQITLQTTKFRIVGFEQIVPQYQPNPWVMSGRLEQFASRILRR